MLSLSGMANVEECRHLAKKAIENGAALEKLREMIKLQGGNEKIIDDYGLFKAPTHKYEVRADRSGYISSINCEECGICALMLGAGRAVKNADIDPSAGIILNKLLGDKVEAGEVIAVFYTSENIDISEIEQKFLSSYGISDKVEKNFSIIIE